MQDSFSSIRGVLSLARDINHAYLLLYHISIKYIIKDMIQSPRLIENLVDAE